jgi:hypothetical protein
MKRISAAKVAAAASVGLLILAAGAALADNSTTATASGALSAQPAKSVVSGDELKSLTSDELKYVAQVDLDNLQQLADANEHLPGSVDDVHNIIVSTCANPSGASTYDLALTATFFTMFPADHLSRGLGSLADDFHNAVVSLRTAPPAHTAAEAPAAGPVHSQLAAYKSFDTNARQVKFASYAYPEDDDIRLGVVKAITPFSQTPAHILDIYKPIGKLSQKDRADIVAGRINEINQKIDHWWLNLTVEQTNVKDGSGTAWVVQFQNPNNIAVDAPFLVQADADSAVSLGMTANEFAEYLKGSILDSMHSRFRDYDEKTDEQIQSDPAARNTRAVELSEDANDVYKELLGAKQASTGDAYSNEHIDALWARYTSDYAHAIQLNPNALAYYAEFLADSREQKDTHPALEAFTKAIADPAITPQIKATVEQFIQSLN